MIKSNNNERKKRVRLITENMFHNFIVYSVRAERTGEQSIQFPSTCPVTQNKLLFNFNFNSERLDGKKWTDFHGQKSRALWRWLKRGLGFLKAFQDYNPTDTIRRKETLIVSCNDSTSYWIVHTECLCIYILFKILFVPTNYYQLRDHDGQNLMKKKSTCTRSIQQTAHSQD